MAPNPVKLGEVAGAATALWGKARDLLVAQPFEVETARQMIPELLALAEVARSLGLDKNWKELRKASDALADEIERTERHPVEPESYGS